MTATTASAGRYNRSTVFDPSNFSEFAGSGARRAASVTRVVIRQPNWIARVAMMAFAIIVAIPFLILFVLALLVGGLLFGSLALINALLIRIRGVLPNDDGRKNVRVIRRD